MTRSEILKIAKPILFNMEMVRAILDGRKTVTRRVIKPVCPGGEILSETSPYKPGDYLYVRETWAHPSEIEIKSGADTNMYLYAADQLRPAAWGKWHPSIHMPKDAARIFLRVTDVRAERLQDITVNGLQDEGLLPQRWLSQYAIVSETEIFEKFRCLWDSTIKPKDRDKYGWAANPWVWVIEFEKLEVETL